MADNKTGDGFDLERFQQLVELMEKHDLREVKLQKGAEKWFLRRGAQEVHYPQPQALPAAYSVAAPAPPSGGTPAPATSGAAVTAAADDGLKVIKSPMVGTFYKSPSPDDPAFVKEGDRVSADTVVCLIEAMKFFNQVKAEVSGVIAKVLVSDGAALEYGQPLFKVKAE